MTQPPEIHLDPLTDAQICEDAIVKACRTIRQGWPDMLEASTRVSAKPGSGGGSRSAGILADKAQPVETAAGRLTWLEDNAAVHDVDPMTRLASLRREAVTVLNSWCRLVMDDRDITNPKSLPLGDDVIGMARFMETEAEWLSKHDASTEARDELGALSRDVSAVVDPWRKEWHRLGSCTFVNDGRFCHGTVRVHVSADSDEAACSGCEKVGPVEWWEHVLGVVETRFAKAEDMARTLAQRLLVTVTERTVRNWARDGRISCKVELGPTSKRDSKRPPRMWFNVRQVVAEVALMDRECPTCGGFWSGEGKVCARCWYAQQDAKSTYGDERPEFTTGLVVPMATPPDMCSLDERARCSFSDLPVKWCACGHHKVPA